MSTVAYNLTRKIEWMGTRLRWIDQQENIKVRVADMTAISNSLKEVETKWSSNSWQPWSKRQGWKKNLRIGIRTMKPYSMIVPEAKVRTEHNMD